MQVDNLIAQIDAEIERLQNARSALQAINDSSGESPHGRRDGRVASVPRKRRGMTPAGRKRMSELMKARWAERRKKAK